MCVQRITEARSCKHCWGGKSKTIIYSECVFVALGIQHAMRMRHTVICSLPRSTIFFHIIPYTGTILEKKKSYSTQNVFRISLHLLSETFPILRKSWGRYDKLNVYKVFKCPLFLPGFNETWIILHRFPRNTQIPNFMKICPVGDELFYEDAWKDRRDEAKTSLFAILRNTSKKNLLIYTRT